MNKKDIFKVLKQMWKEFRIPLVISVSWVVYSQGSGVWSIEKTITAWSTSFFLASWGVGQFFRVKKQAGVESGLMNIESKLNATADKLEEVSEKIIGNLTGGDSFCYLHFNGFEGGKILWLLHHCGDYPIKSLHVDIVNIGKDKGFPGVTTKFDEFAGMSRILALDAWTEETQSFNAFFNTFGSKVVQEIRFSKGDMAFWLTRDDETLIQLLPEDFELDEEDSKRWPNVRGISGSKKEHCLHYQLQQHLDKQNAV